MLLVHYRSPKRDYDHYVYETFRLHQGKLKLEYNKVWDHDLHQARFYPLSVEVFGETLNYLFNIVQNIPFIVKNDIPLEKRSMIWHGDLAKFIVYNLDMDWRPVPKEHW